METNTKNREEFQRHVRRKNQDRKDSHPLIKMELPPADPKLDSAPGENAKTEKEEEKSKPFVPLANSRMRTLERSCIRRIIELLDVRSLDCTNFCAVFPEFAEVRSQVLADYYDKKNDLYSHNSATGFLSPDHCRTPIVLKSDDTVITNVQFL